MFNFTYKGKTYLIDSLNAKVYRMRKDGTQGAEIALTGGGKAIEILKAYRKSKLEG